MVMVTPPIPPTPVSLVWRILQTRKVDFQGIRRLCRRKEEGKLDSTLATERRIFPMLNRFVNISLHCLRIFFASTSDLVCVCVKSITQGTHPSIGKKKLGECSQPAHMRAFRQLTCLRSSPASFLPSLLPHFLFPAPTKCISTPV